MRTLAGLAIVAAGVTALASGAQAQPGRLSDVAYVEAARCAGLANSGKLGSGDASSLNALLKAQAYDRLQTVLDQADDAQARAKREANRADDMEKTRLQNELSSSCASYKN
jgi:hypothetical protein